MGVLRTVKTRYSLIIPYSYCRSTKEELVIDRLIDKIRTICTSCWTQGVQRTCLIPVYSVDTVWENRNHKKLIRLIKSVTVEKKRLIFNTDVEVA
ncbi:hypothetical protein T06_13970 [Trichinella sp. T6]|nr:hypothetical protein T06_13970 [Trichinella sp. T6]